MINETVLDEKLSKDIETLNKDVISKINTYNTQRFVEVDSNSEKFALAIENHKGLEQKYYNYATKYHETMLDLKRLYNRLYNKKQTMLSRHNARVENLLDVEKVGDKNSIRYKHTLIVNGKRIFDVVNADQQIDTTELISNAVINARYNFDHRFTETEIRALENFEHSYLHDTFVGASIFDIETQIKSKKLDLTQEQQKLKHELETASDDVIELKCANVFYNNKKAIESLGSISKFEFSKLLGDNNTNLSAYFHNFETCNHAFETACKLHNINVLANVTESNWQEVTDFDYINAKDFNNLPGYLKNENGVLYINPALAEFNELSFEQQIKTYETAKIINMVDNPYFKNNLTEQIEKSINKNAWLKDEDGNNIVNTQMISNYSTLLKELDKKK